MKLLRTFVALCLLAAAGLASATNYTLWINGRTGGGAIGNYNSWNYWGPGSMPAGVNKKSVNWDGRSSIASQSILIRNALDCFCTGNNWCYIATHSAGDLLIGYTLANYGGSGRPRKNAVANASGVCGDAGGFQTGWNIKWVRAAAGSGGGSELADYGAWTTSEPLVQDVRTKTARAMYNHNETRGIWFYMYAGAGDGLGSFLRRARTTASRPTTARAGCRAVPARRCATRATGSATTSGSARSRTRAAVPSGATTRSSSATTTKPTATRPRATGAASLRWSRRT